MKLFVNGEPVELENGLTILQWIQEGKGLSATAVVERNGEILNKGRWPETVLQEGDRLEVFQFLGGG